MDGDSHRMHPLGLCVPRGDSEKNVRIPSICIMGPDAVLGETPFLSGCTGMGFRARSDTVECLVVSMDSMSFGAVVPKVSHPRVRILQRDAPSTQSPGSQP